MSDLQEKIALIISGSPTPSTHSKKKAQAAINTICEALLSDDVVLVSATGIRNRQPCGYQLKEGNVFCDDERLPDDMYCNGGCGCKADAKAALTAAVQKLKGEG